MSEWMIVGVGLMYVVAVASCLFKGNWQMAYLLACYAVASHALILVQRSQG